MTICHSKVRVLLLASCVLGSSLSGLGSSAHAATKSYQQFVDKGRGTVTLLLASYTSLLK
jgi:hypothetical protein